MVLQTRLSGRSFLQEHVQCVVGHIPVHENVVQVFTESQGVCVGAWYHVDHC